MGYDKDICRIAIGYNLGYNYWGKGYASEALNAVIEYLFNFAPIQVNRIEGLCAEENAASCKVMEKSNMTKEGVTRQSMKFNSDIKNVAIYAILREDYQSKEKRFLQAKIL